LTLPLPSFPSMSCGGNPVTLAVCVWLAEGDCDAGTVDVWLPVSVIVAVALRPAVKDWLSD